MITIVAHFRTEVVKFIFAGRKSGQKERKPGQVGISNRRGPGKTATATLIVARESSIAARRIMGHEILGDRKNAGLTLKLDSIGGVS